MPSIPTRRGILGTTAAGLAGIGLVGATGAAGAQTATPPAASGSPPAPQAVNGLPNVGPQQQPGAMFGSVADGKVDLPPLHADSEAPGGGPPNPDPPARRLGVAVVGLGNLSLTQILPGLAEAKHVRLAALVSGHADKARAVAAQYGVPETHLYDYANFDRIRDDRDVDYVYIVLPNALHLEFVTRAARAGKHVLCEKPMATSSAEARQMIQACRDAGRKLMIAYRCQYEPHFRAMLDMARKGGLGSLRLIEGVNGQNDANNGQWRQIRAMSGGGSLPDVGIYCLNAARFITGEEPVEVSAQITQPRDDPRFREVEDICAFTLRFPSGVIANCSSGYSTHESRQFRVIGSDAFAEMDPAFPYEGLRLRVSRKAGNAEGSQELRLPQKNQFALEMDHFAEALRANREPHTPGEEGLADHLVMEAIYQAAASGSTVRLPQSSDRKDVTRGPAPSGQG